MTKEKIAQVPCHVAIVMDGNGRWAKKRKLPRIMGHIEGIKSVREVLGTAAQKGVRYLTLYSFSTENWKRPKEEVDFLFKLIAEQLEKEGKNLNEKDVRVEFIGNRLNLPGYLSETMSRTEKLTRNNKGVTLVFAINYGGRQELIEAFKNVTKDGFKDQDITEEVISRYLYNSHIPDPELIIRTSGEKRLSNFLLWQSAYSELYFTPVLWPDFRAEEFEKALISFSKRKRRFGGI